MSDKSVMSARQAAELDFSFERNGLSAEDVKWLSSGSVLADILNVRRGLAEIKPIDFTLQIPALSRMETAKLLKKYGMKSVVDNSPTEAVTFSLEMVLTDQEDWITGERFEGRVTGKPSLGLSQALWIIEHQDELPAWFKALLGKVWIAFTATVAVGSDGFRRFPHLYQGGERWSLDWSWFGHGVGQSVRLAVPARLPRQ